MRPIGPGIRTRRKRWFLVVAGSRTGHPLQGEVPGGMTLAVFTCRGRPAALNRATLRRHGFPLGGGFPGGYSPPGYSTPACACFAFCNRRALCHTPRGPARCSAAPGLWDGPGELACRVPSSWSFPARAPGVLASPQKSAAPADTLKWPPWCAIRLLRLSG